jgi:hypothetical protein
MLATAYYCASYGGEDDYLVGSEQDDLEQINDLLLRLSPDEQQRSTMKEACWMEAQRIVSDYWPAVQALATKLLKRKTLDGRDVHRIIWQTIGYPDADWRFGALHYATGACQIDTLYHFDTSHVNAAAPGHSRPRKN